MTALDVKEKLSRILDAVEGMQIARRNLEKAENLLTGISIDYSNERVTNSQVSFDRIGDQVDQLAELRQIFEEKKKVASERMIEGINLLDLCTSARGYEVLFDDAVVVFLTEPEPEAMRSCRGATSTGKRGRRSRTRCTTPSGSSCGSRRKRWMRSPRYVSKCQLMSVICQ